MQLLLVSDLHYALRQLDWLVERAADFDVVVIAGDTLDIASVVPLDAQIVVVLEYLARLRELTTLIVSSGNHDLVGADEHGEQSALWLREAASAGIPTDGASVALGDTLVTVCPWWDGPLGREAVAAQLAGDAAVRPQRWIWVYHWPPAGSPTCWTGRRDYGDGDLGGWIAEHRPDLVLSGHVHQSPFVEDGNWADRVGGAWVLNAGNQRGPVPARIEIDLDRAAATWYSLMGAETADLSAATAPARTVF